MICAPTRAFVTWWAALAFTNDAQPVNLTRCSWSVTFASL